MVAVFGKFWTASMALMVSMAIFIVCSVNFYAFLSSEAWALSSPTPALRVKARLLTIFFATVVRKTRA